MHLRIVMPVLNEGVMLAARLLALQPLRARGVELVVVDGGSTDNTLAIAAPLADGVCSAPRGRAAQMNAGARAYRGDALLFLHADTTLPPDADRLVAQALHDHAWGRFDVCIDGTHPMLHVVAWMMNQRSRLTGITTGDQALFVRRRVFEAAGGFAPIALMEDIELSARLKAVSAPACLRPCVQTSGRRWEQHGLWRTIRLMWQLRAAYACGAPPHVLAQRYGYRPRAAAAVAIMAKAPVPGLAKTRLIPVLGAAGAARAQRRFTLHTLATATTASSGPVQLWCTPDIRHRFFQALQRRAGMRCSAQPEGDLGARMGAAVQAHFAARNAMPLVIVGTDCPVLTPSHLQLAADALQTHDAVLIPAEDGGYVLLGLRRPLPGVFEAVHWSTPDVLEQTRARLQTEGARWLELPTLWDVDEPADWARLRSLANHPGLAHFTTLTGKPPA